MEEQEESKGISRVNRSKEEAKIYYDRMSAAYDWLGGIFERRPADIALRQLDVRSGETVLEIGFGTGHCLKTIAILVGKTGKAHGIDISGGMLRVSRDKLDKATLLDRVQLCQGDASRLPFKAATFDAIFMSFTLELFDTPEIPQVLKEAGRVLKMNGRLGVISLSKTGGNSLALGIYEWIHKRWPRYVDCRPIYLEHLISKAGYVIQRKERVKLLVLPLEIVVATKKA
jgi:demethylmenaquinone methyltransferase/2-methoxy-6-polyprenyl-1,4-benzoquinol methylase